MSEQPGADGRHVDAGLRVDSRHVRHVLYVLPAVVVRVVDAAVVDVLSQRLQSRLTLELVNLQTTRSVAVFTAGTESVGVNAPSYSYKREPVITALDWASARFLPSVVLTISHTNNPAK